MPPTNRTATKAARARKIIQDATPAPGVIVIDSSAPSAPDVLLFELDGEKYYMPGHVPAGVLLAAMDMRDATDENAVEAMLPMVATMLGERTMAVIRTDPRIGAQHFMKIMQAATSHIMDAASQLGNS